MAPSNSSDDFIQFSQPDIGENEVAEVIEVLRSGWTTSGPKTAQFEKEFKRYVSADHALAVNSCTAALHAAMIAMGIKPGDEVITTPLTFCATVNTILHVGATPVLADIGPDLNIDPTCVKRLITEKTRAIVPVHFAGLPCKMDELWNLSQKTGIDVIEDAAHAAGAKYKGKMIGGGQSTAVAFSFYATKNLSTGEGGMIVTNSSELYTKIKTLCLHGISRDAWDRYTAKGSWYYEVVANGFKYNMSDIMAAIGIHQLRKLDRMNARREEIAFYYNRQLSELPEVQLPPYDQDCFHPWHLYVLRLNLNRLTIDRAQFIDAMRARGIGCSVHFIPIPLHPYYQKNLKHRDPCSRALNEYPRLVSLPIYSKMTDAQVERVIAAVRHIIKSSTRRMLWQGLGLPDDNRETNH